MKNNQVKLLVFAALMAALTCAATMAVRIPSPLGGYINLGDCVVLLCGFILPLRYGVAAAGIGSMLADLLAGYAVYVPGTLVIKAMVALIAGSVYMIGNSAKGQHVAGGAGKLRQQAIILSAGILGELFMVAGYFIYAIILGNGGTAVSTIPGNLVQGAAGIVLSMVLLPVFSKVGLLKTVSA